MKAPQRVSVHGGHSGQFCNHASDSLEDLIKKYIELEFSWVGITEHTPAASEIYLFPEEISSGLNPGLMLDRFAEYIVECRRLQKKYAPELKIFVAMEIETYSGYKDFVPFLLQRFRPDYIVGSVHFIEDVCFDFSKESYAMAVKKMGSIEQLYCSYFDAQYEMINVLQPAVVGHFDLIRIFDKDYKDTIQIPTIQARILRNLKLIKEKDLILDFNLRALLKGAQEPYISRQILELAKDLNIAVVPGDDSHGTDSVGCFIEEGLNILKKIGFPLAWREPATIEY